MSMDSFDDWVPLQANGLTDLGEAFLELNRQLSKNGFMDRSSATSGFYAPVIILLSDGDPTDDWLSALKELQKNKWYQASLRVALAIGDDPNLDILRKFIRNPELLFHVTDISQLKKVVRFIAVTSSQVASTSAVITENTSRTPANSKDVAPTSAENILNETLREQRTDDDFGIPSPSPSPAPVPPQNPFPAPMPSAFAEPVSVENDDDEWDDDF
jgi:uncharacterized protein YegL